MGRKMLRYYLAAVLLQVVAATNISCPTDANCTCGGTLAIELDCNIDGSVVNINLVPEIYINVKCENATALDYSKLPRCTNITDSFQSVSFKDCPLPETSFKDVLDNMGVTKTMALIFQNAKNLSGYLDRKHFAGLQDLTKLLLSINGVIHLPDDAFVDINKLTWLNIRSKTIYLSEELFKPLERLETLEISHNHMTNITSNLFSHLSFLRKLSLWQSNVTWFSQDFFNGVDVLEELDLSSNGLNKLPATIFKPLKKLKKLTLFSNKFSSLPKNLFIGNNELETVVILNNDVKLRVLPERLFGNLPNLKQVYVQRSGIEVVPRDTFKNSPAITNISLAFNDLKRLPEEVFNNQINLLNLDLSHNKIFDLATRTFSTLVRLEILNLCNNQLVFIDGSLFSSLLSLIDLNIENNNLKIITSDLFRNNKQRMSISLANNNLDFEQTVYANNCLSLEPRSPFANTYNLKLLNLSHNAFRISFVDWWINGHEIVDVSHNAIKTLVAYNEYSDLYEGVTRKPLKELWVFNNPIQCVCNNYMFVDLLQDVTNRKIMDARLFRCPKWQITFCSIRVLTISAIILGLCVMYAVITMAYYIYKCRAYETLKWKLSLLSKKGIRIIEQELIIRYSEKDEEFVMKEILPTLKNEKNLKVYTNAIRCPSDISPDNLKTCVKDAYKYTTLIVFSPNYLTTAYSNVDIKKIHSEMLKAEYTVYVFVDIGPENFLYVFLKSQRDTNTMVVWGEANFWLKFLVTLAQYDITYPDLNKISDKITFAEVEENDKKNCHLCYLGTHRCHSCCYGIILDQSLV
ncbi:protein toll-like [Bombyx mandarina]|uniref:Protein toll-like n=1 Tax=Bombyx mandarina TaxID=7092 RepID=A0A6J2JZ36_BOMMA|nr:protein toll-like [Bombyx mandarina]